MTPVYCHYIHITSVIFLHLQAKQPINKLLFFKSFHFIQKTMVIRVLLTLITIVFLCLYQYFTYNMIVFILIFFVSVFKKIFGIKVTWKDRSIKVGDK